MISWHIVRKIEMARKTGLARSLRIMVDKAALGLLQKVYGFHPWHVEAPLSARPYRRAVANMVDDLDPECVVEVGCGLGVTLSLVKAKIRFGYDVDDGAIRAARMLRNRSITFNKGGMTSVAQNAIDVLILVNWIHDYSPQQLDAWLAPLMKRSRYLLLDAIDADNPLDYRFKHNFAFLQGKAQAVCEARAAGEGRRFIMYKVNS